MADDLRSPARTRPATEAPPPVRYGAGRARRLGAGLMLVLAGVALGLFLWSETRIQVEETSSSHLAVDRVLLDLRARGSIEIDVHDRNEIVVEERIERTFSEVTVSQEVIGEELRLTSERCWSWMSVPFDRCAASFVVTVPASTSVAGSLGHGHLRMAGLDGAADVRTAHGSVEVAGVRGPLNLQSGHGSISVEGADQAVAIDTSHGNVSLVDVNGRAVVRTAHGSVSIQDGGGDLRVVTRHGAIDASETRSNLVHLASGHGSIEFTPAQAPASARIATSHGHVHIALPANSPAYAVTTHTDRSVADIGIATDPDAGHSLEVTSGHGRATIIYASR